jgi:type I restriction enzyme, S subunit
MNWPVFRLDEVSEVAAGNPAPQKPVDFAKDGFTFIRMQDVGREHHTSNLRYSTDKVSGEAVSRYRLRLFPTGSVLIPKSGASVNLNHRAMLGNDAYVVSHLAIIVPNYDRLLPEYLYYWSLAYDPRSQAQTTSLPSLPLSLIKAAPIPLPSFTEQRRIVDILSRAEGIVRLRREAQKKAAEIIPTLFVDIFGDPATNPMGWPTVCINDVCSSVDYGSSTKASDDGSGIPLIRMGNVDYSGYTDLSNLKYVVLSPEEVEKYRLLEGDVLFNRTNSRELVGKTGLWDGSCEAVAASYFIRVRVKRDMLNPLYFWAFMNTRYMKRALFDTARGAIGQSNINAKELKAFVIGLPPIKLQNAFEGHCRDMFGIKAQQAEATVKAGATFAALLGRIFNDNDTIN